MFTMCLTYGIEQVHASIIFFQLQLGSWYVNTIEENI